MENFRFFSVPILKHFLVYTYESLTLLHSERPKLYTILDFLSAMPVGLIMTIIVTENTQNWLRVMGR